MRVASKFYILPIITSTILSVSAAQAALIDRGNGLIYDTVLNVTWLQNANLAATDTFGVSGIGADGSMTWDTAQAWIGAMNAADYKGYNNWRLPTVSPVNGSTFNVTPTNDGSTDISYNISAPVSAYPGSTASELAYMYYNDLGLIGHYDTSGNLTSNFGIFGNGTKNGTDNSSWGQNNVGLIQNLQADRYWTGTQDPTQSGYAFDFLTTFGHQATVAESNNNTVWVWAVLPGDVAAVPEPETYAMMLAGLGLVAGSAWRRKHAKA